MKRASVVRLIVDKSSEEKLKLLCSLSSKLWNEVNYARRRMFFEKRGVNFRAAYREFYEKYKTLIGSATAQQVLNKNDEAWRSFFKMLKLKKDDKLPPFITKISPPGYRKKDNKRSLWTALRKDQYRVEGDKIVLKGLGVIGRIELRYEGLVHLRGEQGRLEIHYDSDRKRWYAHISFEVSEKAARRVWTSVPKKPGGDLVAGIDIGINNLMAIYVENGLTQLVNGRPLKAISHYWRLRIAEYQSMLNKYGLKTSRRLGTMYSRWRRQVKSYVDSGVRQAVEWLYSVGVSIVKVGYPKNIARENGDFNNVHVWTYGYLLRRIYEVAEEYGITAVYVGEAYTSSKCPIHGERCGSRVKRGLFKCTKLNKVLNADLVGAYNILITPSPMDRGNGPEARPGIEPKGDVVPNLPALAGTFAPLGRGGGQCGRYFSSARLQRAKAVELLRSFFGLRIRFDDPLFPYNCIQEKGMMKAKKKFSERFVGITPRNFDELEDRQRKVLEIFSSYHFERILDVGCGDGNFTMMIARACKAREVYGVEISEKGVEMARKNGIKCYQLDVDEEDFPFEDNYFDAVSALELIEHLYDPDHFLDEVYRVLKPEGIFVLSTPNLASIHNRVALLFGYQPFPMGVSAKLNIGRAFEPSSEQLQSLDHVRVFTLRSLKELLKIHNFKILAVKGSWLSCQKI